MHLLIIVIFTVTGLLLLFFGAAYCTKCSILSERLVSGGNANDTYEYRMNTPNIGRLDHIPTDTTVVSRHEIVCVNKTVHMVELSLALKC